MGEVTEFCGVPGIGKTQLGIQLAVDVHLPMIFGGAQGEAVYVDTEGSFMAERANDIASAFVNHVQKMVKIRNDAVYTNAASFLTTEHILDTTYVYRVHDYCEQIAVINQLSSFLDSHPRVKVVIIDSIAFLFRHGFEDYAMRSRILNSLAQKLTQLANEKGIAGEHILKPPMYCVIVSFSCVNQPGHYKGWGQ